ncbi:MAG: Pilus assembly protein FimV [uncultured Thiotrichaceae bacterium]|uniref:Pilus assembly protein FimV n=1 Tax=uncultured Thiotrichaceae bacterium TaxID=298394 RepID=A0A6S6U6V8_9GAMM|nr:MAG: Pilus assembly protein FimV [uncultured Thiotrichaceae bacterium]
MERGISVKKHTVLGFAISMALSYPVSLSALGLGEIHSNSQLNQPLRAQIDLLSTSAEEAVKLQVRLASPDVFSRVGIDRPPILDNLKFTPTMKNGKPVIMVSSDQALNEPFLNFLLEVSWPQGQLLKEYTVLLDPPVLLQAGKTGSDNAVAVRAEPKSASGVVERTPQAKPAPNSRTQIQVADPARNNTQQKIAQDIIAQQAAIAAREEAKKSSGSFGSKKKYRVKRGDTMRKVAAKFNDRNVGTDQMMVALFRANPQAFFGGNINNLKAGSLIVEPVNSQVTAVSTKDSKRLIKQHYTEWKNYRTSLAKGTQSQKPTTVAAASPVGVPSTKEVVSQQQANLKIVGSTGDTKDSSKVSASGDSSELMNKLALAQEALASSKSENAELESRVSKLEAIVRKKDRLIQLKNDRLARLEGKLGSVGSSDEEPAAPVSIVDAAMTAGATENDLVQQAANDNPQNDRVIRNDEPIVEVDDIEAIPPVQEGNNIATANAGVDTETRIDDPFAKEAEFESGILDLLKSPVVAAVGLGSLLSLVLAMLYMRRRSSGNDDTDFIVEDEFDSTHDDALLEEDFATNNLTDAAVADEFEHSDTGGSALSEEVATIGTSSDELDALLSEESHDEDEILQEADVYIVYGLHEQAEEELKKAISEKPEKLEYRVKLMENYEAANNSDAFVSTAKDFLNAEGDKKQALWDKVVILGKKAAPENGLFAEQNVIAAAALFTPPGNDLLSDSVDIDDSILEDVNDDLNSDFIDFSNEDVSLDDTAQLSGLENEIDTDDFDFGMEDTDFGLNELTEDIDTKADNILNFDVAGSETKSHSGDIQGVSLDIDGASGIDKILPADSTYTSHSADDEDLDDALSFLDLSDDDQEMQEAHIGTKLDLARAYLDMGDVEGARCTLEEVVVEGNDDQKREAEELLQQTG